MTRREQYEERTEQLVMPIVDENNFELVDIEYVKEAGNWFLRVYIDKQGGITIDDCELVSRALSEQLDKDDFIEDSYILEVSSPGLGRPLKKEKDFERSIGKEVEVLFEEPHLENGKKFMKGHTTNYMVVKLETNEKLDNMIKKVKIDRLDKLELIAE